ncbi:unnamed protein product [Cuscuta campestris]|uniref:Uncharacterized protein n=1 Tax=Cuscuta campestris TaxID=132261 RepID=A0A484N186_9ASTE|nr:unnamed protein product [Cuscuta campestris]
MPPPSCRVVSSSQIGLEWTTQLVRSQTDEKLWMDAMMVAARKDAKTARLASEKMKEKPVEQAEAYQGFFAKHEGLLKSGKESNEQA